MRMTDRHGNTVEVVSLDGQQRYVARDHAGYVLHSTRNGIPDPVTPADLTALGVDLASLALPAVAA